MKDGKVDRFIDDLIHLAALLGYSSEFAPDMAPMGMPDVLNATWSMKTPNPVTYKDYLNLLYQTGHQLEDASNFRLQVQKKTDSANSTKSDGRNTSEGKRQRKEKRSTGPWQQKARNRAPGFTRPAETEYTKMYGNVP